MFNNQFIGETAVLHLNKLELGKHRVQMKLWDNYKQYGKKQIGILKFVFRMKRDEFDDCSSSKSSLSSESEAPFVA